MAKFLTDLVVRKVGDGDLWELTQDLHYDSDILGVVYVPERYTTDFASVRRLPFLYWLFGNTAHAAATIHDYLYTTHPCTKIQADRTFLEAMEVTGVPQWRRNLMFAGVVAGGWYYWWTGPKRFKKLGN